MARLSVNLNKIALLRNSRKTGVPDPVSFVPLARRAGAEGITLHPRPDERHVRRADVPAIAAAMEGLRPAFELNLEGYPDERFLAIVREIRPEQVTFVPDAPDVFTSDKGFDLDAAQRDLVAHALEGLKGVETRVILFVDPDPEVVPRVAEAGAHGIEIYTGSYAEAWKARAHAPLLDAAAKAALAARERGLVVNAGHDLNLENIPPLVAAIPHLAEASIGHELTADALVMGFEGAVAAYAAALRGEA
ncbi:pyridoxine 5'-phosphate synthase [Salinarimonas sp.]|uniref:pyridoxine 5'-phosphate synthase n=1 Tax=Salinarimonas sp. TaxID=2766526 RepID=UPI0032D904B5